MAEALERRVMPGNEHSHECNIPEPPSIGDID